MKKLLMIPVVAGVLASSSAWAVNKVTFADGPGLFGGGEFIATITDETDPNNPVLVTTFNTFCVEYAQPITFGVKYDYTVNDRAVGGGPDSGDPGNGLGSDPLSGGSAFLFQQFLSGALPNYAFGNLAQREIDARTLQVAIWWLEDEVSIFNPLNNKFLAYASTTLGVGVNDLKADNNGTYAIGVMNVWGANGSDRQDVLVPLPDGGMTLSLLGSALMCVGFLRRKL